MSQFFEKHKRKSLLALLLLLLRGRKGAGAMLLMVFLLMFLFVLPQSSLSLFIAAVAAKLPGGEALVKRLGGAGTDFSALTAAFRAARDQRNAGWGVFFDAEAAKRGRAGRGGASSLDMVKGGREDFLSGANLASKIKGGETVGGILTPEDAERRGEGVAIAPEDLEGQRAAQLAAVGAIPGGAGSVGSSNLLQRGLLKLGAGLGAFGLGPGAGGGAGSQTAAYAPRDFFSGKGSAATRDPVGEALREGTVPPRAGPQGRIPGGPGRMSAELARLTNTNRVAASGRSRGCAGARCAFQQLTSARTSMMLARDPQCTAANGCPPEFAASSTGHSFDGNKISGPDAPRVITSGDPATAPLIDGISTPNVSLPDQSLADRYQAEAEELRRDSDACKAADEKYRHGSVQAREDLHRISQEMEDMGCGDGDCSRSKARRCKRKGNEMKAACREMNRYEYLICLECPLRRREGCNPNAHDCS